MSSYLNACDINMGENMIGAMRGNMRGHFEDSDIVQLHDDILTDNRCHMYSPKQPLNISADRKAQAEAIIRNKLSTPSACGWKDPRSTLFLDFWQEVLPDCKFVLLYRDPFSVIDSLRRRGTDRRIRAFPWLPASAWLDYNTAMLDFYSSNAESSVIINISGFNKAHEASAAALAKFLDYELNTPYTNVLHKNEIAAEPSQNRSLLYGVLDFFYKDKLSTLYNKLEAVSLVNSNGLTRQDT